MESNESNVISIVLDIICKLYYKLIVIVEGWFHSSVCGCWRKSTSTGIWWHKDQLWWQGLTYCYV